LPGGVGDLDNVEALGFEGLEVTVLMLEAAGLQDGQLGIVPLGLGEAAHAHPPVEHSEVPTRQVPDEVGRAHDQLPSRPLHDPLSARQHPAGPWEGTADV
jgi:hypothetical protein